MRISIVFRMIPVIIIACVMGLAGEDTVSYDRIIRDNTIIAPGVGSDGVLLNEDMDAVATRFGLRKFKISKPRGTGELFKHVFKVDSGNKIYFDSLYYHEEKKFMVCVFRRKVVALVGFNNNNITTEAVSLRSGISSFMYYYGNRSARLIKSDSNGIYLYPGRGIAVIDDGMNDTIDVYIVFSAESARHH